MPEMSASPEQVLFAAAASRTAVNAFHTLDAGQISPEIVDAAEFHGLSQLLYVALAAGPDGEINSVVAPLQLHYRDSAKRALVLTARLGELSESFNAAAVPFIDDGQVHHVRIVLGDA